MFKPFNISFIFRIDIKTLFFPLFASFFIFIFLWFDNYNHELFHFNERILGIATMNKIDVNLRLDGFYKAIFFGLISFVFLSFIFNVLYKIKKRIRTELLLINYLSLTGIFVEIFYIFGQNVESSLYILSSLIITLILISIIKIIFFKHYIFSDYFFYLWSGMISFSVVLLFSFFTDIFSGKEFLIFFTALNTLLSVLLLLKNLKVNFNSVYKRFRFIVWIPVLIFFSQEIFLIFNQRSIRIFNPELIFLIIFVIILLVLVYRFLKSKNRINLINITRTKTFYFTSFIIGILFFTYYTPFANEPDEMFEIANISNSIMNFFKFGKFPVLEFLPTHLGKDLFYGYLYSFLNGYQADFSFRAYYFIYTVFSGLIFYLFLTKITNHYTALIISLFFPFTSIIIWGVKGAMFLLVPLILYRLYLKLNLKNLILFFLVLLIEIAWSADSGFASLVILITGLIIILSLKYKKGVLIKVLHAFLIVFLPVILVIIIISLVKNINVTENIKLALEFYSSSPQARGREDIASDYNFIFIFQHILFPFIILLMSVFMIFMVKNLYKRNPFAYISILALATFYLLNFQRGLTRHSFYEGNDTALSSFLFLILGLTVYMLNIKSKILKHSFFIVVLIFLIFTIKLKQSTNQENILTTLKTKLENSEKIKRSDSFVKRFHQKNDSYYIKNKSLISFFEKNLNEESTYFDFSNQPLIYFLTQNEMPVYFIHFLAVTNDLLQEKVLEEFNEYDIPFIIFSSYPKKWWDHTDGIENSVRYYKIAEYIYIHYTPYSVINEHYIWKRNDFQIKDDKYIRHNIPEIIESFKLKKLPYVWANYDADMSNAALLQVLKKQTDEKNNFIFEFSEDFDKSSGNFLELYIKNKSNKTDKCIVELYSDDMVCGKFTFDILNINSIEKYLIRPGSQYNWFSKSINILKISFKNSSSVVEKVHLLKGN